jgi:hypothetical protein
MKYLYELWEKWLTRNEVEIPKVEVDTIPDVTITDLEKIGGQAPQLDDTDKLGVSLYGKDAAAGDKALNASAAGNLEVDLVGVNGQALQLDDTDKLTVVPYLYNGSGHNPLYNNHELTLLASAARTAQTGSDWQYNRNHLGMVLFVEVTAIVDTPIITPAIDVRDPISLTQFEIWSATTGINSTGNYRYLLFPGAAGTGSYTEVEQICVPRQWKLRMAHADADSITYSVACCMLGQ